MNVKQKIQDAAKATFFVLLSTPKCRNKTLGEQVVKRTKQLVKSPSTSWSRPAILPQKMANPIPTIRPKLTNLRTTLGESKLWVYLDHTAMQTEVIPANPAMVNPSQDYWPKHVVASTHGQCEEGFLVKGAIHFYNMCWAGWIWVVIRGMQKYWLQIGEVT